MKIIRKETDHCEERKGSVKPTFLIIHYTETKNLTDAEDYFMGRKDHPEGGRVSAHYMIDQDGSIVQYVDEAKRAWHAGVSHWGGIDDINLHSIGIELVNPGRKYGYQPFPVQQMDALVRLCKDIMSRHIISPHRVLGHSDVAPTRKQDPGELFKWQTLAQAGIGVWPEPGEEDRRMASDYVRDKNSLKEAFLTVGFDPQADMNSMVVAFQRHFYPEAFTELDGKGRVNETMAARLHWLVRNRPNL